MFEDNDQNDENGEKTGRRGFLVGAAGAAGAGAALMGSPLPFDTDVVSAQSSGRTDIDILNFALTLEHLENEFYKEYLNEFSERDFQRSSLLDDFGFGVRFTARDYVRKTQEHEKAHVNFLETAISDNGGTPVGPATQYDFAAPLPNTDDITTVEEFSRVAQILESTGVDAYAGAAPEISNAAFIPPALSIHSVEANHAAFYRNLNSEIPFPDEFNDAKDIGTVLNIVDPIIVQD